MVCVLYSVSTRGHILRLYCLGITSDAVNGITALGLVYVGDDDAVVMATMPALRTVPGHQAPGMTSDDPGRLPKLLRRLS